MSTRVSDVRFSGRTPPNAPAIKEIRDNLIAHIAEAERGGRLGEVEGLQVSLADAEEELRQLDRATGSTAVDLGIPTHHAW